MALKNYKSQMNKNFPIFQGFQPYCSRPNMQRDELKNYDEKVQYENDATCTRQANKKQVIIKNKI